MLDMNRAYNELLETSWRRKLTSEELSQLSPWLAAHPEARLDWEAEAALSRALDCLPPVPVSGNFTALVLERARLESASGVRYSGEAWWTRRLQVWLPRLAFSAVLLVAGLSSFHYVRASHRTRLVEGVAIVSQVASLPSAEILQDFDAIRALDEAPAADEELLRILQ